VNIFADEEIKKCHEWAKHGVEGTHFTGNDAEKLDKDVQDKRVKKKVAKVMSALHGWSDVAVDPVMFPAMVCGPTVQYFTFHTGCLKLQVLYQ